MKKLFTFLFSLIFFGIGGKLFGQCATGEVPVTIDVSTDQWGYEAYWELVPSGNSCGTGTIFSGGNASIGCGGGGAQVATSSGSGAYGNNASITEGPFCLTDGVDYDIIVIDDWGDGGTTFSVATNGFPSFSSTGSSSTFTFTAAALPDNDASLVSVSSDDYVATGTAISIQGNIKNMGSLAITSIDVTWDDGSGAQTQTITGLNIASGETGSFTHPTQLTIANPDEYNVTVTLTQTGDADLTNNEASFVSLGITNPPTRTHVFEEATGTWCGWCVRGHKGLHDLDSESNTIGIAVHNGDPMVVTAYDNGIGNYISGYPSGLVNRSDKMTGSLDIDPGNFVSVLNSGELTTISPFDISVVADNWDATARTLDVTVSGTAHSNLSGDYRLNFVMIENNVQGTSSGYDQANYYSSSSQNISLETTDINGNTVNFQDLSNPISYTDWNTIFGGHQHVARTLDEGWDGLANSVPATLSQGDSFSHTFTVTIDASWDIENMRAVGWISNKSNGEILNADETEYLWSVTAINEVESLGFASTIYPNPNSGIFNLVINSDNKENFEVSVSNLIGQNVYNQNIVVDGIQTTTMDLSDLKKGVYFITVEGNDNKNTTKVIIE